MFIYYGNKCNHKSRHGLIVEMQGQNHLVARRSSAGHGFTDISTVCAAILRQPVYSEDCTVEYIVSVLSTFNIGEDLPAGRRGGTQVP